MNNNIYNYIVKHTTSGHIDKETAIEMIAMLKQSGAKVNDEIAIIGMSAKLPGANNIQEYWDNIMNGIDCITNIPDDRRGDNDRYADFMGMEKADIIYPEFGYLDQIDGFDYDFFRMPPKEASLTDPNQRIFLEQAWKTIEDAGYGGSKLAGSKTGVYLGYTQSPKDLYSKIIYDIDQTLIPIATVGNMQAMTASRISHMLNLKGPALVIDTACSSALIAIELACQSIKQGQCDMALAGGIHLKIVPLDNKNLRIGIESTDWRTRTFDDTADGSGVGEGVGAVLLKPLKKALKDGDHIYAVIKGNGANHDGTTAGITVPNPSSQSSVIQKAWEEAGIDPETLDYIETHGTGTKLGDPIEIKGIEGAFQPYTDKKQFCAIGSIKSNIGHLNEAAGIASVIKMALALKYKKIPPTIHFNKPNTAISFTDTPLYVNTKLRDWDTDGHPRRGGVSGFGMSGTNCHIVLEQTPEQVEEGDARSSGPEIFTISARDKSVLIELLHQYEEHLEQARPESLRNMCYTANTGRGSYAYRLALLADDLDDLQRKINTCLSVELESLDESWASYGYHKVARIHSEAKPNEISEQKKRELSENAQVNIEQRLESGAMNEATLTALCEAYVAGADIVWDTLYEGEKRKRISLPTYPFQSSRCWIEYPDQVMSVDMDEEGLYYEQGWVKAEEQQAAGSSNEGAILVIRGHGDDQPICESLAQYGQHNRRDIITAVVGNKYVKHDDNTYTIRNLHVDYTKLLKDTGDRGISQIAHLLTLQKSEAINSIVQLEKSQDRGLYSLFYLYKAVMKVMPDQKLDILLLSEYAHDIDGAEQHIKPENATIHGLAKVMSKEHPHLNCRSVDIDDATDSERITYEIIHGTGSYSVAFRHGIRYVEEFAPIELEAVADEKVTIKEQGVYVITGGTGGIGLEIAKSLSSSADHIKLALVNRSTIAPRDHWDAIVAAGTDSRMIHKIQAIRHMEQSGAEVKCYQANVSNEQELKHVLADVRQQFKRIDGVVHGAGIAMDQLLSNKQEMIIREVLFPKVHGTWLLDQLTQEDDLDFFVMLSSVASIFSGATQGDYVAANAYMDAFTSYRNRQGKKTLAINWTTWKETGLAASTGAAVSTIFRTLSTANGIEGFRNVLNKKISRVLIGQMNTERLGITLLDKSMVKLSSVLERMLEKHKQLMNASGKSPQKRSAGSGGEVMLTGREGAIFSETEKKIAGICKEVLGYAEIDVYDNFFELGADSILLMRIHSELDNHYPGALTVADMFEHSSISKLAEYFTQLNKNDSDSSQETITKQEGHPMDGHITTDGDIAIIGMSLRLPMADTNDDYWRAIQTGLDHGSGFPEARRKDLEKFLKFKGYPLNAVDYEHGTYLEDIDKFDYRFFRLSPKEAGTTDPNHRQFLQTAWHAIEDAGYGGKKIYGTKTGVYLGFASNMVYFHRMISEIAPEEEASALVGNTASVAVGRLSYLFDLKGPSMVIDTACSSSLTAVHLACKSIRNGDCNMAIAGGVRLNLLPIFRKGSPRGIGMESADGKTRAFDHFSEGTGSGEGVAAIVLKPLSQAIADRDHIYAVVKGSASNQDGSSAGLTAPNPAAQEEVILRAWEDASIDPETISYIETHGTGTQLGDPIEIQGIQRAFSKHTHKKQFCAVGSSKSNITHLAEAAGIAGVIKSVLALQHKEIPPNILFNRPNRKIDFNNSPIYVNVTRRKWETNGYPRRCGVSGFGMSGTNCHIVMEEHTGSLSNETEPTTAPLTAPRIMTLSAMSETALKQLVSNYRREGIREQSRSSIGNISFTANTGRGHYAYRLALIVNDIEQLEQLIIELDEHGLDMDKSHKYYCHHKVVSESKVRKTAEEITEKERIAIGREAAQLISQYVNEGRQDDSCLVRLCELYVQGADVDWEELYRDEQLYRVSLPTYPYDQERCWIETPDYEDTPLEVTSGALYYAGEWIRQEQQPTPNVMQEGSILLFLDSHELGHSLAEQWLKMGKDVVKVYMGSRYEQLDRQQYTLSGREEDYVKLLTDNKHRKWSKIVHLFSIDRVGMAQTWESFSDNQMRGMYSLYYLTKAVAKVGLSQVADVVIIADYVDGVTKRESRINPSHSALFTLGKSVRQELENLACRCIDIDDATSPQTIMQEIMGSSSLYQVAYRDNERYVEIFKECRVDQAAEQSIEVKEDGVYVITGGTGGMGIEAAKYLASRSNVNIALLNRTPMPDKSLWDGIVSGNSRMDQKLIQRIKAVREVEAMGAQVVYHSLDVANLEQMEAVIGQLRQSFGRINGVIHGAGIGGDGLLYVKDEHVFNEVVGPKLFGTWILDKLTEQDRPDFFIMFSSMSSRFTVQGQGDYAAANAFQDSYAKYRSLMNKKTLTINWVVWKDTGMALEFGVNVDGAFKALPTARAMKAFDEVLNKQISNVLIGEINFGSDILWELGLVPQLMDVHIEAAISQSRRKLEARQQAAYRHVDGEIKLTGKDGDVYSDLEAKLAAIYCSVLGFNEIDIYDNFFELGGDSILLSRVHAEVEKGYPGKIRLLDLFEYTSVYKLCEFMTDQSESSDEALQSVEHAPYATILDDVLAQVSAGADELEKDTKRLFDELEKGSLSIEQALEQLNAAAPKVGNRDGDQS